jgi:Tol biopolymer transport system component
VIRAVVVLLVLHLAALGAALAAGRAGESPRRQLAYYTNRNSEGRIMLADVDRGFVISLLKHDNYVVNMDWSPDGNKLAFTAYDNTGVFRPYIFDLTARRLIVPANQTSGNEALHWSPDGRWIAFNSYLGPHPSVQLLNTETLNVLSLDPPNMLWNMEPTWSPDGARLIFTGRGESVDLFEIDVNCPVCEPRLIVDHPASDRLPVWSPIESQLAFVSDRSGRSAIYVTDLNCADCGEDARHIADLSMISTAMAWSPDGQMLAYTSAPRGVGSSIYLADLSCADCPPRIHLISQPEHVDSVPSWSPDGRTLAFVSRFMNVGDIAVMDIACATTEEGCAGQRRLLTQTNANVWSPVWRPG